MVYVDGLCRLLLPLQAQMRLRCAAGAHLDEGGNAVEHDRQALCVDAAAFVHQFRQQLEGMVRVLQPLGRVIQQLIRIRLGVGEIAGVADDLGFAMDVVHKQLLAKRRPLAP